VLVCFKSASNFFNFKVKKEVLAFESVWIVKSCFVYEVYFFYTFKLTPSELLLPFYLIESTMPMFISPCYLDIFGKVSRSLPINPPTFIFN
jgi:hypothetical protein